MRPSTSTIEGAWGSFPRVSGDAPVRAEAARAGFKFSPRERGCAPIMELMPLMKPVFPA